MLPVLDLPTYELKVPSTGQAIKVRPFTVKEEKLLLIAAESSDPNEIINTTKQVIKNCIVSDDLDVDKLPFFDVDYLFIALRAKSVGEAIEIKFTCNNIADDGNVCGNIFPAKIDIASCKIVKNDNISKEIDLGSGIKVKMKYPSYSVMKTITEMKQNIEKQVHIICNSIEYIQDKTKVYTMKDVTPGEIQAFVEGLTREQYNKLETFINNFPSFIVTTKATCTKCNYEHSLEYKDFVSFFR